MPLSIRSRLLLLLSSVLLPGVLGVCWLVTSTIDAQRADDGRILKDAARSLSLAVDDELARRATLARVLALAPGLTATGAVGEDDLEDFGTQARAALQPDTGWIELWGLAGTVYDTRSAVDGPIRMHPGRDASAALSAVPLLRSFGPSSASAKSSPTGQSDAVAALIQPVEQAGRTVFNVAVMIPASEIQRLTESLPVPSTWSAAVIDARGRVVAAHRAAEGLDAAMFEQLTTPGSESVFESHTIDGRAVSGSFHRNVDGWVGVVVMPGSLMTGAWPDAAKHIVIGALLLFLIAGLGSMWLARRIARPLQALTEAGRRLHNGLPVQARRTGIAECDEVSEALANASEAIRHGQAELEQQVSQAVARTRMAEQLRAHSQRVEALGRLTGGVAHDFNNLLGIISNSIHLMRRHPAAAELQAPLRATQQAVDTGSQLTQHLLRFAGRRPTRPERLHLAHWLSDVRDLVTSVLGRSIAVDVEVASDTPAVTADPGELELALLNLTLNARDAMPGGGTLQLKARKADAADLQGRGSAVAGLSPAGDVLITVSDDGVGIEAEQLQQLFEPFYTTKPVGKGSGLGLSQVLGFCKQAGGTAWAESTVGVGTTVCLLLPAAAPAGATAAAAPGQPAGEAADGAALPAPGTALSGRRVLLVEDNAALAETTDALLRSHGAMVRRASDGASAIRLIEDEAAFDVVLSDVVMPGAMDGLGLARHLQQQRPGLPVLLISGHNQTAEKVPQEFVLLHKPCPPDVLLAALRRAVHQPEPGPSPMG